MSYSKLPLVIQDFALGFQTINQARDNAEQLVSDIGQKHGRYFVQPPKPYLFAGRHNDLLVPRGVHRVDVSTVYSGNPYWWTITQSQGIVTGSARLGVGNYLFQTAHLGANQWVDVCPNGGGAAPRLANARYFTLASPSTFSGILVQLYELDSGAFTPNDYSFSLRFRSVNT